MLVLVFAAGKEGVEAKTCTSPPALPLKVAQTIFAMISALIHMEKKLKEFVLGLLALSASVLTLVNSCFSSCLAL
ncbi:hypothetical protein V6N13_090868 [Hibiscus sabdariffa]|uniref:Uncharacterized protein n=1 Tax=Hibiscus sabdariffa TaxID=183260 RepID=A0ABR2BP27_9ROSI